MNAATLYGPEIAPVRGPFSLVGEYSRIDVERKAGADPVFEGWNLEMTWTLGGESRASVYRIDAGEFRRLTPDRNFRSGEGGGTWELAARYASLDLNDESLAGGEERAVTVGVNWYVNPNIRFMLDWTRVIDTDTSTPERAAADGLSLVHLRAQYAF